MQATVLICQCGSVDFKVDKTTRTSIALRCERCGLPASVKGGVARAEVDRGVDAAAREEALLPPGPATDPPEGVVRDRGYRSLRFRVSLDQDAVLRRALDAVRVMNWGADAFRKHDWQGAALEAIAADFLSGVPPEALAVLDEAEAAVAREAAKVRERERRAPSVRRQRDARWRFREALVERRLGPGKESLKAAVEAGKVPDGGRLLRAVEMAYRAYAKGLSVSVDYAARSADGFRDLLRAWRRHGGFLLLVRGDERTTDDVGARPMAFLWELLDEGPDIAVAYREVVSEIPLAAVEVVELIEPGQDAPWQVPRLAAGRREPYDREWARLKRQAIF